MNSIAFKHNWTDEEVESHWDNVAHIYIKENNRVKYAHDQRFVESIRHLDLQDGMKVLNISSRDAEADDYISRSNNKVKVYNTEISANLIKEASKIRPHIMQFKIDSYSELPFRSGYFDRILTLETLEHVSRPLLFLSELFRVAKPGTRMVLSCPPFTAEVPYRLYTLFFGGHGEGPHRFPRINEVKHMLAVSRWELLFNYGSLLLPVGTEKLQKLGEIIIKKYKGTWVSSLGIRQFYICERGPYG